MHVYFIHACRWQCLFGHSTLLVGFELSAIIHNRQRIKCTYFGNPGLQDMMSAVKVPANHRYVRGLNFSPNVAYRIHIKCFLATFHVKEVVGMVVALRNSHS